MLTNSQNNCTADCSVSSSSTCTARPTFSLRSLMILVAIWSVLFTVQSWQSMIVVSVILLTWLFGCNRTRRAVWLVTPALLLPSFFVWIVGPIFDRIFDRIFEWQDYLHLSVLPGAFYSLLLTSEVNISSRLLVAAIITACAFLSAVTLIRFLPKTQYAVIVAAILFSFISSYFAFMSVVD